MRVYYIYSFKDARAQEIIAGFDRDLADDRYRPFHFSPDTTSKFWKRTARKKISDADLVVFFLSSKYAGNRRNIDYEISKAQHYGKMMI